MGGDNDELLLHGDDSVDGVRQLIEGRCCELRRWRVHTLHVAVLLSDLLGNRAKPRAHVHLEQDARAGRVETGMRRRRHRRHPRAAARVEPGLRRRLWVSHPETVCDPKGPFVRAWIYAEKYGALRVMSIWAHAHRDFDGA